MRRRRRTAAGMVRDTWRRRYGAKSAMMHSMELRRLGDDLHRISRYIAESASHADSQPRALAFLEDSENEIRDIIFAMKNEISA